MVLFLLIILIMISVYWRPMWGILRGLLLGFLFLIGGSSLTNVHSIYPYNKKLHAEAKSAECEIFYHPKKPKKMFCPEDIAKDYYTIWILRFLIGGTIIATDFYF